MENSGQSSLDELTDSLFEANNRNPDLVGSIVITFIHPIQKFLNEVIKMSESLFNKDLELKNLMQKVVSLENELKKVKI